MPNQISPTNFRTQDYVNSLSRYINSEIIYYGDNHLLTFKTYVRTPIPSSTRDKVTVINSSTEYRPDLVSYAAYGTPDFWWKIMEANNLKDILDFKSGLTIRLPDAVY